MTSPLVRLLQDLPLGSTYTLKIISWSMHPSFKVGDTVTLHKVPITQIEVGDVISFSHPGLDIPIVHRVVKKIKKKSGRKPKHFLVTKGDNVKQSDRRKITEVSYLGKVIKQERSLKTRLFYFSQKILFQMRFDKIFNISK